MVQGGIAFCSTCHAIQPPVPDQDYFQVFGFPLDFLVDDNLLEQSYQALQKQFHPDCFATCGVKERRFSLEHVTHINRAYQTLKDPNLRSEYLLVRLGYNHPESGKDTEVEPEFLMEVMEVQEALAAIDLTSSKVAESLEVLRQQTSKRVALEQEEIIRLFGKFALSSAPSLLAQIAQANNRSRYHRRFLEALDRAEEKSYGGHAF